MTQVQLAQALQLSERQYQNLEAGGKPSFDIFLALADYFGVSLDYLAGRSDRR